MPFFLAGVTMLQSATRVKPNCFSFRRQIQILQRAGAGGVDQQFQDHCTQSRMNHCHAASKILQAFKFAQEWEASTSVARAFKIGKGEAAAVSNLMCKIPTEAVVFLEASVKCRGMLRYLSHDILGRDLLNAGFSSGLNGLEHWKEDLRNTTEVVPCTE